MTTLATLPMADKGEVEKLMKGGGARCSASRSSAAHLHAGKVSVSSHPQIDADVAKWQTAGPQNSGPSRVARVPPSRANRMMP